MTDKVDEACDVAFEAEFGPDIAPVGIPVAFNGIYADTVRMLVHRGTREGYRAAWQRLSAENEELRKDAERYRWMKRFDRIARIDAMLSTMDYHTLDAAVDAAMQP